MTVSTELQRMKTAIDNAYNAAEEKGATIPEIESSENLAATISSITPNLQDKIARQNGIVTADTGYDGLSQVTVDVSSAGPSDWYNWRNITNNGIGSYVGAALPDSQSNWQILSSENGHVLYVSDNTNGSNIYAYSSDGESWNQGTLPITATWNGNVINGKYFLKGSTSVLVSSDGETWNSGSIPSMSSRTWADPIYGNNIYCSLTKDNTAASAAYSYDLVTWYEGTINKSSIQDSNLAGYSMAFGNGIFVSFPWLITNEVYTSTNGIDWTLRSGLFNSSATRCALAFGGGTFVAAEYNTTNVITSTDGTNWTSHQNVLPSSSPWYYTKYANGVFLMMPLLGSTSDVAAYSSDNGVTWTSASLPVSTYGSNVIVYKDKFVLVSDSTIYYSSDGHTWDSSPITDAQTWKNVGNSRISYNSNQFMVLSSTTTDTLIVKESETITNVYTDTTSPSTTTTVYDAPKVISAKTITSVGTDTITLSDTKVYTRNLSGDTQYPLLGTKTVTINGTYTAENDNLDGFSSVTVDVPSAPTKKYNLLDRVKDDNNNEIGTVSGFFTDANNVEYVVVCLDAQYRLESGQWCSDNSTAVTDLPIYSSDQWGPWEAKETATYNTQKILDFCDANGYTSAACSHCRTLSFTIDGTTYYGQLPNMIELNDIVRNHTALNTADPTAGSYNSVDFSTGRNRWSSSQSSSSGAWRLYSGGNMGGNVKSGTYGVVPVLEISNT